MKNTVSKRILVDCLIILLCYVPFIAAACMTYACLENVNNNYLKIILTPFLIQIFFVISIFAFRLVLPKLKAGVFPMTFNKGFLTWLAHSMLTRSALSFGIHYLIHSTALMRWLYWRALGANVPYNMGNSYKVTIHDAQLISIGTDSTLAEGVEISCHLITGDRVLIAPVRIGESVFIGRETYIGPRTRIGNKAWIGMNNNLNRATVADNEVIKSNES
jgi:hypothetical protein